MQDGLQSFNSARVSVDGHVIVATFVLALEELVLVGVASISLGRGVFRPVSHRYPDVVDLPYRLPGSSGADDGRVVGRQSGVGSSALGAYG